MLIYLFLVSLLSRLTFLFLGHPSITHDEADFYLNSFLVARSGSDVHNHSFFLSSGILSSISPIPVYLGALFFLFLPKGVFTGRLPYAILNSFIPVLIYYIVNKITGNKKLSFFAFLVSNFSPWLAYSSSQAAFDSPLSFMFYLASITALISDLKPTVRNILFTLFLFLSFNSYMGIKVSFVFLIMIAFIIQHISGRKKLDYSFWIKKSLLSISIFAALAILVFISPGNAAFQKRATVELLLFNQKSFEHTVWYERYVMTSSELIKKIASNKLTVFFDQFTDRFFVPFNPKMLFFKGDPHPIYGTYFFGLFYLFDFIFLIYGVSQINKIFQKRANIVLPFILLFLVSPLPVALSTSVDITFVLRAYPLLLPFSFMIALGGYAIFSSFKKYYLITAVLYFLAFSYFVFIYEVKIKPFSSEQWQYSPMVLFKDVAKKKNQFKNVYVYTNEPRENALLYYYYGIDDAKLINKPLLVSDVRAYTINNVHIADACPSGKLDDRNLYIIRRDVCDARHNQMKKTDYKLIPYINAYDHSGTLYWRITNSDKNK